jgi:hypothetical protein
MIFRFQCDLREQHHRQGCEKYVELQNNLPLVAQLSFPFINNLQEQRRKRKNGIHFSSMN